MKVEPKRGIIDFEGNDHYQSGFAPLHYTQTEQRIFVLFNGEDSQRRGHYYL
jgi:hypothetical protein